MSVAGAPRQPTPERRSRSERLADLTMRHPFASAIVANIIGAGGALLLAAIVGLHKVGSAFSHVHPVWIAAALVAQLISVSTYVAAYGAVMEKICDQELSPLMIKRLVFGGFGAFAVAGGFAFDERTLRRLGVSRDGALVAVLVLSGLELITIAWLALIAAVVAVAGIGSVPGSFSWPWIIGVPLGSAAAVAIGRHEHLDAVAEGKVKAGPFVSSLADVLAFARHPRTFHRGWLGILFYWIADIATLTFSLRLFGLKPEIDAVVLAYASAYVVSRRTLPLAGAGVVEFLMTISLYWVHEPLARSLCGVLVYRALDFLFSGPPALIAGTRLEAALEEAEEKVDSALGLDRDR